jgi:hypothetical protein
LRDLVTPDGGHKFLQLNYLRTAVDSRSHSVHAHISPEAARVTSARAPSVFAETPLRSSLQFSAGRSVALVAWPGK